MILKHCIYHEICDRFVLSCPEECEFYKNKDKIVELPANEGDEVFIPKTGEICVIDGWSIVAVVTGKDSEKKFLVPMRQINKYKEI